MKRKKHTIDAKGKSLGRIAVKAALLLRGKDKENFMPNKDDGGFVVVKNIRQARFTGNKLEQKKFYSYSGYPGGIKETVLVDALKKDPLKVLRKAVWGMMPKNKLTREQIKRLSIEDAEEKDNK